MVHRSTTRQWTTSVTERDHFMTLTVQIIWDRGTFKLIAHAELGEGASGVITGRAGVSQEQLFII